MRYKEFEGVSMAFQRIFGGFQSHYKGITWHLEGALQVASEEILDVPG